MTELHPLVSVLMTAYNREKYIAAAIESVLASTYKNFELIITDDQSQDSTVEIALRYVAKDTRVKLFVNDMNLGDYPNRNHAASKARGKYLKYVDADDYIYPWGLQLMVQSMEQFPEAGWGLCSLDQYTKKPFPFQLSPKEAYEYNYTGAGLFHKAPLSSIIKNEAFKSVGGFAAIRMAGDFEMWHRLAQLFSIVLMPHGIVWSREHNQQEMNSYLKFTGVYEKIKIKYLLDNNCPLSNSIVKQILMNSKRDLIKKLLKAILILNKNGIIENRTRLRQYKNA